MDAKQPVKRLTGCLFGIIGGFIGYWLAHLSFELHVQKIRAADPNRFICGNDAFPGMLLGLIFGCLGGILFGKVVAHFLNRTKGDRQ